MSVQAREQWEVGRIDVGNDNLQGSSSSFGVEQSRGAVRRDAKMWSALAQSAVSRCSAPPRQDEGCSSHNTDYTPYTILRLPHTWSPRHSGSYSISPSILTLPRCTFSPLSRIRSSIVAILPFSVASLNQPIWSAIRCLARQRVRSACEPANPPRLALGTLNQDDALGVCPLAELMR